MGWVVRDDSRNQIEASRWRLGDSTGRMVEYEEPSNSTLIHRYLRDFFGRR